MPEKKDKAYPSQFDKVKEITDRLEAGVLELMNSESYKTFLKTMAHFHAYSLNNTILIALQRPDSTYVAGYAAWKKNFGRQVLKGEQGIRILAPTPYKKKMEVAVIDPATGQARLNPDGTKATEMKEIMVPTFKVVNVFDVSQTDGRPLPSIGVNELTGDVKAVQGDSGHSQTSMVTDVYSHILDDDRRMNAQLFEDAFYNRKEADPSAPAKPLAPEEQKASDMDTLMRLLSNPETAGLLKQLVKAMDK